ncbi:sigma 54-interacting transcriptional regulator [Treponema zuelzerae]|uniref:Sigma 54-interacting transcriptional regulator n=1 Tax=Teretinema zuelzerae TaxID=156 RepID=A0AAE3JI56_9SPIR|nr:sigma 54-interacting transcriptional regulator [Teretinema zuelzerae]MCD1654747.1 sigma 54-interacting transcriptional regulator [Teretinema zuelzerae]HPO02169.1 sigma 54-interacting transcriptional regulator [Treponemataceae bacterium]
MKLSSSLDTEKLNALIEINTLINSNYSDVSALLAHILESAMRLVSGEASSLLLVDSSKQYLRFEIALGPKGLEAKKFIVKMDEGIAGWVVKNNRSLIVNDVANDPRFNPAVQQSTGYRTQNMLAVPMRVKDECIGVIEILNKGAECGFTLQDLEVLEILANQAALAYQNARFLQRSRDEIVVLQDQIATDRGYHTMIARSPVILEKLDIVERVAKSDSSVLILGESGVGKELIAEQLHLKSDRASKPFVRVNCAALPEGLLESELFGHVKGAFTDAISNRKGRFEMADQGTIFLDEIGDLPLALQSKLLRVIQNRTFEKLGSSDTITVNVRIVAATNRDIEKLVEEQKFRSDLYYRLNVLPMYIPPLRQRLEDIPELALFFLKKFRHEVKKDFLGFSEGAMSAIISYSWPGNIRELENTIERACVIGKPPYIREEDLLLNIRTMPDNNIDGDKSLKSVLNLFKKHYIQKVLEENQWNQTATAGILDIQRTYLSRLIKELEIKEK